MSSPLGHFSDFESSIGSDGPPMGSSRLSASRNSDYLSVSDMDLSAHPSALNFGGSAPSSDDSMFLPQFSSSSLVSTLLPLVPAI